MLPKKFLTDCRLKNIFIRISAVKLINKIIPNKSISIAIKK